MAKELKQRKIKNDNKKYIKLSIVILLIITMLSLVIVIILKSNKSPKTINSTDAQVNKNTNIIEQNKINLTENKTENSTNNILGDKLNQLTNNIVVENNTIVPNETVENNTDNNEIDNIKGYSNADAVINGIQREMSIEQVKLLLGEPDNVQTEHEVATDYIVQKYFYDNGRTEIDFIALYKPEKYVVHRIKTSSTNGILTRELKIGDTADKVIAAFKEESILYKDTDLIIIGFPGEDPIYATSIKPKIYFRIDNNILTQVSINIGSES